MTLHGVLDIRPDSSSNTQWYGEAYISLIKFLMSSYGHAIGIQRIAYHTGSQAAGGEGYWNESKFTGNNAWSCFYWASASNPFYMLVQYSNANTFGTSPGNPGAIEGSTTVAGLGFSFAMRADAGNPWNGTTKNNGEDNKGFPVWTSGSSQLFVWPRHDSMGGNFQVNREGMIACPQARNTAPWPATNSRLYMVIDEDHVYVGGDEAADGAWMHLFFGKYQPRSGSAATYPYVCLRSTIEGDSPGYRIGTYGPVSSSFNTTEGGIAHPLNPASGTRSVLVTYFDEWFSQAYQPSFVTSTPSFDEWPIYLAVNEAPNHYGYIGHIDWMKVTYGIENMCTNANGTRLYIGSTRNVAKISIPFTGSNQLLGTYSRSGTYF